MSTASLPLPASVLAPQAIRTLSVVIPVYNSQDTLAPLVDKVVAELTPHFERLEIVLVNDGSRDASHPQALAAFRAHPQVVKYIRLARNFGEHNAVMCGLHYASGDAVAIIDDDFQNPPTEIVKLVDTLREGYDVVYSRYEAKQHHWLRNLGSRFNDRVATWVLNKPRGLYLSSFKAMNRFLARTIIEYRGPYPYIDGLVLRSTHLIGSVECRHDARAVGRSSYTFARLLRLWLNMFTSFSVVPLRVSAMLGLVMSLVGLLLAVFFVITWTYGGIFLHHEIPPGWGSTIVVLTLFSGIQLCVLGMIGEYVGRLFLTGNRQPQYVEREAYGVEPAAQERRG